ncbi:hypothetical protein ACMFMG_002666 [Clarireedia jacksonii]
MLVLTAHKTVPEETFPITFSLLFAMALPGPGGPPGNAQAPPPMRMGSIGRNSGSTSTSTESMPLEGYPKLADYMGRYNDVAIFRRFRTLNMLNLLSLQAELVDLEVKYRQACSEDDGNLTNDDARNLTKDFLALRESGTHGNTAQLDYLGDIKKKLKEYNEALLQEAQISKLQRPQKRNIKLLRGWLEGLLEGNSFLRGYEADTWSEQYDDDMITLATRERGLGRATASGIITGYDFVYGRRSKRTEVVDTQTNQRYYPDERLDFVMKVFTTVVASLFPGLVVLALYFINTTVKRIGAMLAFTALFAFVLSFWSLAKTIDVFAATAAFVAVEVVFIGSADTNGTAS